MRRASTDRARASTIVTIAVLFACLIAACNSQSFKESNGPSIMPPPPAPVQPPAPPINPARQIDGNWYATYPGGPLRVVIGLDPMLRGRNYVATLVDGARNIPAGQVLWRGTVDQYVPNLVRAEHQCLSGGTIRTVKARIVVNDPDHLTEELVDPKSCPGFPMKYIRASAADAPQRKN
jgi:hypothetical protein